MISKDKLLSFSFMVSIISLLLSFIIIFIPGYIITHISHYILERNITIIKNGYIDILKEQIKSDVVDAKEYLHYLHIENERALRKMMEWKLSNMLSIAKNIHLKYNTLILKKRINDIIVNTLNKNYFYYGKGFYIVIKKRGNKIISSRQLNKKSEFELSRLFKNFHEGFIYYL